MSTDTRAARAPRLLNVAHYLPGMILREDLEPLLRPLLNATSS